MWTQSLRVGDDGQWTSPDGNPIRAPDLVLLFGPTDVLKNSTAPSRLAARFPEAVQLGCSSGTTVDGLQLVDDLITAVAIGFERTQVRLARRRLGPSADSYDVGVGIGQELASPDLAATHRAMRKKCPIVTRKKSAIVGQRADWPPRGTIDPSGAASSTTTVCA